MKGPLYPLNLPLSLHLRGPEFFACQCEHCSEKVANLVRNMVTMVGMVITVRPCVTRD